MSTLLILSFRSRVAPTARLRCCSRWVHTGPNTHTKDNTCEHRWMMMDDDGRSEHHPQVFIPIPSGSNHHGPFILHMPSYAHENDFIGGSTTQLWYGKCPFLFSISTPRSPPVFRHRPPSRRLCHRVLTRGFTRLGERERVRAGLQGLARSGALDTKWRGDRAIRRCDRAGDRRARRFGADRGRTEPGRQESFGRYGTWNITNYCMSN